MKTLAVLLAAASLVVACASSPGNSPQLFPDLRQSEVEVLTRSGTHRFKVWIAENDLQRSRGLMFVRELPAGQGMLFLFPKPRFLSFWMQNTVLSLDLIFIAANGRVVNIAREAVPLSESPIESAAPATAVLELAAGTTARIGLKAGDRILHPAFGVPKPD